MPVYHPPGRVPRQRHVAFRKEDGSLRYEELVGNEGFAGPRHCSTTGGCPPR